MGNKFPYCQKFTVLAEGPASWTSLPG